MFKFVCSALVAAAVATALVAAPLTLKAEEAKTETAKPAKKKGITAAIKAARDRQKECGRQWREAKAAGNIPKGQTWPKYWSECNKRLKAQST